MRTVTFLASVLALTAHVHAGNPVTSVSFTNLGGSGQYPLVTNQLPGTFPNCPATPPSCVRQMHAVSGNLSPFNEEMSIQLRGPMVISNIAVYQPDGTGDYSRVSYWTRGGVSENISFLNNLGGGASGEWSICHGNSLSWASADGTKNVGKSTVFGGTLGNAIELTVLSGQACTAQTCGWYRPVGMRGWAGEKILVVEASMPHTVPGFTAGQDRDKPAIWSLNAKIPRTAQYGCNCQRDGCGELDIAEVVNQGEERCWVTMYSWQASKGSPDYFVRPTSKPAVFVTHYDVPNKAIRIQRLEAGQFQYTKTLAKTTVSSWAARKGTVINL
ncbi:protein TOS1 [Jimgerdemannia flammicorona]|uniref:glucan endo-1,3-beta-D-glucosidase n=1 Tax=Jimgerdemannia flammicorona TaxID=994334 RepID=A0A433QXK1_9FUNG|nr:protein TOS1 [Jimgerdemannia flammicorona]